MDDDECVSPRAARLVARVFIARRLRRRRPARLASAEGKENIILLDEGRLPSPSPTRQASVSVELMMRWSICFVSGHYDISCRKLGPAHPDRILRRAQAFRLAAPRYVLSIVLAVNHFN